MNRIGIYYAYWARDWNVNFHPFIDKAAALGFDLLEINAGAIVALSSSERRSLKAHAEEKNLALSYCIGLPPQYDLASPDVVVHKRGVVFLQNLAKAIGEMGGGQLGGIIYGAWPATMPAAQTDKRQFVERSLAGMRTAIKAAEDNNVIFNVEVVNRFEQFLLNTCAEAIAYIEAVDSPNIGILLDTFHMNIEEDFIGAAILQAGKNLKHLHVGENNRLPPGYGHIPWTEVSAALRRIGYSGDVVMEPFLTPGGEVGRDIRVHRDLGAGMNLDEEARKALMFMRGVLK